MTFLPAWRSANREDGASIGRTGRLTACFRNGFRRTSVGSTTDAEVISLPAARSEGTGDGAGRSHAQQLLPPAVIVATTAVSRAERQLEYPPAAWFPAAARADAADPAYLAALLPVGDAAVDSPDGGGSGTTRRHGDVTTTRRGRRRRKE